MIKLALVIPTLDQSGAEKQLTLLATGLPRDQFDVRVAALTRGGPYVETLEAAGIPVTILDKRFRLDPVTLIRLRRWFKEFQPDIVHSWLFAANAYTRFAAGRKPRCKVIVSERCVDSWKEAWQLDIDRRLAGRTTRWIANSQAVVDFYAAHGIPSERWSVIHNGVQLPGDESLPDRDRLRKELDVPAGARIVGYVGRLAKQKRVNDIVWGVQLLKQITENVCLVIVGEGPERPRLVKLAEHMGCDNITRFAGHRSDAAQLMPLFDVFWLASDFEGLSNSLMEAMAAGVPAVVSDIAPNRELCLDGETGFVVKVGDSVGFAQMTDRILADPDLARRLGTAGRERIRTEFSLEKMIADHVALYRSVLQT